MEHRYDPMTGELLQEEKPRFDPMTGELIQEETPRFDPMTGKPLQSEQEKTEPEMRFDPMTGEPIRNDGFDPMTGEPIRSKAQSKKLPVVGAVIGGVVVVAAVLVGCFVNGTFLSKPMKVLLATKRTFSDQPKFMKDLDLEQASSVLQSGKYKLSVNMDADGDSIEGAYASTENEKQLHMNVSPDGSPSIEVSASLSETQLKLYVPEWSNDVYVWNYKEDCDGYVEDVFDAADLDYEEISDALCALYEQDKQEKNVKTISNDLIKQVKSMDWEKADSREFEINGKSRKAKGYAVTFTEDDAKEFLDLIEAFIDENYEMQSDLYKDAFDEIDDEIRDMSDVDLTFYIYRNRLAAVCMEQGKIECELFFKGGDFRMQNMELNLDDGDDSVSLELAGRSKDSKENYELSVDGDTMIRLEYDTKSGHYELELGEDRDLIEGDILKERGQTGISVETDNDLEMDLVLTKDAALEELPDREIDIMEMREKDWMKLFSDIFDSDEAAEEAVPDEEDEADWPADEAL